MAAKSKKAQNQNEETFELRGEDLVAKVKQLIKEGNAREIIIKNKKGQTIVVIPLTLGVVGAALVPPLAAIGAIAAVVTECSLVVKKR